MGVPQAVADDEPDPWARAADPTAVADPTPVAHRVPETLRSGRLALDGRAVAALAVVCLVAVGVAVGYVIRGRPTGVAVPAARAAVVAGPSSAPSAPSSLSATPSAGGLVVVHVAGAVRHPGLVRVAAGSRVADAIAAAGGARPGTDLTSVNLARPVVDGEQVVVGGAAGTVGGTAGGTVGGSTGGAAPVGRLNLNTATREQLEELPGVGPVLAQRILDWRQEHGRFSAVDELREVSGIGDRIYAQLEARVGV
jgi:competence protein ComEA